MTTNTDQSEVQLASMAGPDGSLSVSITGRLDAAALADAWPKAIELVSGQGADRVVVDASGLTYCDGTGLGLLAEMRRIVASRGGKVELAGVSPELERLITMSELADPTAQELVPLPPPGLVVKTGQAVADVLIDLRDIVAFTGEITAALAWAAVHPHRLRARELWLVAEKAGVNALPVICLLGSLVGLIMAFQTAVPLQRYGAVSVMPLIVSISMVRELSPLITAIILAGRTGSAFAAEIGTMKVTQEVDALHTFGLDPVRFLVTPRVLATVLVTPLLTMFNILLGVMAGYPVMASYGYSFRFYVNAVTGAVSYVDLLGGVGKTLVFGLIIAAIGCLRGLGTRKGPSAVGDSTTAAVVAGIILIIMADMVFGVVYFYLGI